MKNEGREFATDAQLKVYCVRYKIPVYLNAYMFVMNYLFEL